MSCLTQVSVGETSPEAYFCESPVLPSDHVVELATVLGSTDLPPNALADVTGPTPNLLELVRVKTLLFLPVGWVPLIKDNGIHIGLCARSLTWIIQRSIYCSTDGTIVASVHGTDLPHNHPFLNNIQNLKPKPLSSNTVNDFVDTLVKIVNVFRRYEICSGVKKCQPAWKYGENCFVDQNNFKETRYQTTCRSNDCAMLVPSLVQQRCPNCSSLCRVLERRCKTMTCETPPKNKPQKDLKTPERDKRWKQSQKEMARIKMRNRRLREKIDKLLRTQSVFVDDELGEEMNMILNSETAQTKLTAIQKIFIEQQVKAAQQKNPRGMRWHPAMIRLALSIQMSSPQAYEELSGLLRLPSRRQLFNYSHILDSKGTLKRIFRRLGHLAPFRLLSQ